MATETQLLGVHLLKDWLSLSTTITFWKSNWATKLNTYPQCIPNTTWGALATTHSGTPTTSLKKSTGCLRAEVPMTVPAFLRGTPIWLYCGVNQSINSSSWVALFQLLGCFSKGLVWFYMRLLSWVCESPPFHQDCTEERIYIIYNISFHDQKEYMYINIT